MNDLELHRMSLEALEMCLPDADGSLLAWNAHAKAVVALRERLAQPVQQAPRSDYRDWDYQNQLDAQEPEQEPVAWWHDMGGVVDLNVSGHGRPLYFAPQRREWVGLTEEEFDSICDTARSHCQSWKMVIRAIEAKLREKNA